jgi:hypothetical protein
MHNPQANAYTLHVCTDDGMCAPLLTKERVNNATWSAVCVRKCICILPLLLLIPPSALPSALTSQQRLCNYLFRKAACLLARFLGLGLLPWSDGSAVLGLPSTSSGLRVCCTVCSVCCCCTSTSCCHASCAYRLSCSICAEHNCAVLKGHRTALSVLLARA